MASKGTKGGTMGRVPLLQDEDLRKNLLGAISEGMSEKSSCELVGISEEAINSWKRKGAKGQQPYAEFVQDLKKARQAAVLVRVRNLRKAASNGAWQADAWWLERMYPEEFGRRDNAPPKDDGGLEKVADAIRDLAGAAVKNHEP